MTALEITVTRQMVAATTSLPTDHGVVISMPSEHSATGVAYVAFVTKRLSREQLDAAAYSLAHFNGDLDRLREYEIAVQRAADAD